MGFQFPVFIDIKGNNCLIIGGGTEAAEKAQALLQFQAKVTVIHPTLCPALQELEKEKKICYIPRKYYRGDCSNAYLCIAATGDPNTNIAISQECKARRILVYVADPPVYGNFDFPNVVCNRSVTVALSDSLEPAASRDLCHRLAHALPDILS